MRIALISDSHIKDNIDYIFNYLKEKSWKLDLIIINGDVLGENEVREGYGFNFNKKVFNASLNKLEILKKLYPDYEKLKLISENYLKAVKNEETDIEMSKHIKNYIEHRYDELFTTLQRFSTIQKTFYNLGNYESPLQYNILRELSFLLDTPESYLRSIALLTNYRDVFKVFQKKIKDSKSKKLIYIGGSTQIIGDLLIAGIPGLNSSSTPTDNMSEFQEKITSDLMNTITRQLNYVNKLLIVNQSQGKLGKDPFAFRPGSLSVRRFIESIKGKLRHKIFVQSYHHFMTTHFYEASEFNFILNNSAVNNCLFNLIDISTKVSCYDVDAKKDKVRKLKHYNFNLVDYNSPQQRLALNYEDSEDVIKERSLKGCYYI